jgi:hypothetical protein
VVGDDWLGRQHVPLKRRSTIILLGSTTQKTALNNIIFSSSLRNLILLLVTSIKILLLYISWVFPYTSKKIKICGGPLDSVKIRSRSWSLKVCHMATGTSHTSSVSDWL